jgi:hypothetical protein
MPNQYNLNDLEHLLKNEIRMYKGMRLVRHIVTQANSFSNIPYTDHGYWGLYDQVKRQNIQHGAKAYLFLTGKRYSYTNHLKSKAKKPY